MAVPRILSCGVHGEKRIGTVVCRHHVDVYDRAVGFVENSDDPNNLQAWCDDCEAMFVREGAMTDEFRRFNDFALVCIDCYASFKARHSQEFATH